MRLIILQVHRRGGEEQQRRKDTVRLISWLEQIWTRFPAVTRTVETIFDYDSPPALPEVPALTSCSWYRWTASDAAPAR